MQHQCGKAGEQPWVKTDGGMCGDAKTNVGVLGSVRYGALATHGMTRGAKTAPSGATNGTSAVSNDGQATSSSSPATTGKETTPPVVLVDEAKEKEGNVDNVFVIKSD
ncbi:hypothetical protein D1007_03822 [Hordeum vulgare]|nr:hypothetical protein D1007_03822 [Hordeum vulgare]